MPRLTRAPDGLGAPILASRSNHQHDQRFADGFILTGGSSTRMGRNKALLSHGGRTLLEHVAAQLEEAVGSVRLVGRPDLYRQFRIETLPDAADGCGPISGIVAALRASEASHALITACDLPLVNVTALRGLLDAAAAEPDSDAVIPVSPDGRIHPLCAVYHRRSLPAWERALAARTLRVRSVLDTLRTAFVPQADGRWLTNVNTPADWAALQEAS